MSDNPILVEVTRGTIVESRHRGSFVLADADGIVVASLGNIATPVMPRSAVKPLQALPLIESGAADRFALSKAEIALACSSHRGEPRHVDAVTGWLARIGLGIDALECGTHAPLDESSAHALAGTGTAPTPAHNNCSGKHAGFLTTAVHLGEPIAGYITHTHPVQRRIATALSDMTGQDVIAAPYGIDGCGIPTVALPLGCWATAMARLADGARLPPSRAKAAARILDAMASEPFMVSGTNGLATRIMETAGDRIVVKPGAEGVYAAILRQRGLALMLKMDDGAARGAELALATLLVRLGLLTDEERSELVSPPLANHAGRLVGRLQPSDALQAVTF
jgi:L-asparaginase II